MKTTTALLAALALGATVLASAAQDQNQNRPPGTPREGGPGGQDNPNGPGNAGGRPRIIPPIIAALDANGDGVIDEKEMAAAAAALKKLDKNGDGKLTMEELMPPRPQGDRGPGGPEGQGGQGGQGVGGEGRRRPDGQGGPGGPENRRRPGGDEPQQRERPKSE